MLFLSGLSVFDSVGVLVQEDSTDWRLSEFKIPLSPTDV